MSRLLLVLLLVLSACADLPRPYQGAPGANATRLAKPPPSRVAVLPMLDGSLPVAAAHAYEQAVARALQEQEVPAVAEMARPGDWSIALRAEQRGGIVLPEFRLLDPRGKEQGVDRGRPVPERLWRQARPELLARVAAEVAPRLATLLARVDAASKHSDPASLRNQPGRLVVSGVSGAPGDGNQALARLMRERLGKLGLVVQDSEVGAAFNISARVRASTIGRRTQGIEIIWLVRDGRGGEIGRVEQRNEIPAGTLDRYWGDVAVVVTEEAAEAIHDLVLTQSERR